MTLAERREVAGMKPQRADILPAGIIVLDAALEVLGRDSSRGDDGRSVAGHSVAGTRRRGWETSL